MFPDDPLGAYPYKTFADARVAAKRLWNLRSDGVDPRAQRLQQIREQHASAAEARTRADRRISLRALFDRWRATDLVPRVATDGKRQGRKDGGAFTGMWVGMRVAMCVQTKHGPLRPVFA